MYREKRAAHGAPEAPTFADDGTPRLTSHRIEEEEGARGRIRCGLCHSTWNAGYQSVSSCPGVPNFGWWDQVPPHLKTRTALGKEGLKPGGPARGCIPRRGRSRDEYYYLFDEREAIEKRKPSEAQLDALERGRRIAEKNSTCARCKRRASRYLGSRRRSRPVLIGPSRTDPEKMLCQHCGAIERWEVRDRPQAIEWARSLIADPEGFVVFDSETTGLEDADFVEVAAVRGDGEVLIDSLVKPLVEVKEGARAVHGIADEQLLDAPSLPELYPRLSEILQEGGMRLVVYNAEFDREVWEGTLRRHGLKPSAGEGGKNDLVGQVWECCLSKYAAYVGDFYDHDGEEYRWQRLSDAGGDHSALGDARAALALVRRMAEER